MSLVRILLLQTLSGFARRIPRKDGLSTAGVEENAPSLWHQACIEKVHGRAAVDGPSAAVGTSFPVVSSHENEG